ncbi:MAG TPA: N-acetylmuramoyl-L-alanine amidase [Vicinamibacterales bacterium]|jgi:N-acetylmuramoyl-L-alanine amidase|nr:N-acetylmuramoyl-L-alanine amidase [Vicinamibacterales bacterium]
MRSTAIRVSALAFALLVAVAAAAGAQSARLRPEGSGATSPDGAALFKEAAVREAALRRELSAAKSDAPATTQRRVRTLVGSFEDLARLFPVAGQADKALWQGAALSADLFFQAGDELDRDHALQLLAGLQRAFPGSAYARQAPPLARRLEGAPRAVAAAKLPPPVAAPPPPAPTVSVPTPKPPPRAQTGPETAVAGVLLTSVRREVLADAVRVTFELDREVTYHSERIQGPERVFLDLLHTRAVPALKFAVLPFDDDIVRRVRIGAHPGGITRVVLDLEGGGRHSIYTLYNPYRIVVDVERVAVPARPTAPATAAPSPLSSLPAAPPPAPMPAPVARSEPPVTPTPAAPSVELAAAAIDIVAAGPPSPPAGTPPPVAPAVNARGGFSLSRQLGLGIARIVIDAGHGGHDPGARVKGLSESELTLDVALRLEKLLLRQPGVEVIQTRRTNAFVPLEERTDIANRSGADIFLSIHANASEDRRARGVETYFLNFAPTAEAETIAARENAASTRSMRQLPELVRAIALNNKLDESRDLARLVQESLFAQARKSDRRARNLGVKQAPFMVLVGAQMPSILTEISFLTNLQDAGLLATEKYRQQIAEALLAGITRYQQALKKAPAVATQ